MSDNARLVALIAGIGALLGGGAMMAATGGGGFPLAIVGLLVLASLVWERRYGRQGRQKSIPHSDWQLTDEKFIDDETGEAVEVWIDPLTGERRYEPLGSHPRIADRSTHR
jgi:hypothetical protein